MKRLIEAGQVCAYLKIAETSVIEPHIDSAHALVASVLEIPTLDARDRVETHRLQYDTELIELRDGPMSLLNAVTVNGDDVDLSDLVTGYWTIQNPDGWSKDDIVIVDYTAGWGDQEATSGTRNPDPPDALIQALIQASGQVYATPNTDLVYEKIGDYTKQTAQGVPGSQERNSLDPRILRLLRQFMRPNLFC